MRTQRSAKAFATDAWHRCAHGLYAGRGHDDVEVCCELGVPVAKEEAEAAAALLQARHEVARYLGGPGAVGVSRHPQDLDSPAAQLDHEQHVVTPQQHGVAGEEVGGEHTLRLGA